VIKSGTIKLPYDDPMTGMSGTWNLAAGTGPRSYMTPDIPFAPWGSAPFSSPPNVVVSLTGIQATSGVTQIGLFVQNVQIEEFNIRVDVSADCTLDSLWVTWIAYDAV
jgi:H-type lectin domain